MMKKTWKVKNKNDYTDEELIEAIKQGTINGNDLIISDMLKDYIKVSDSIYQFYLEGHNNETI